MQAPERPVPIRFAALSLIERTEQGFSTHVEAIKVGERWFLFDAQLLDNKAGTLLLIYELDHLLALLPKLPADAAEVVLQQQFNPEPPMTLIRSGQAAPDALRKPFNAAGQWQIQVASGTALTAPTVPWQNLLLAGLAILLSGLCALLIARRQLRNQAIQQPRLADLAANTALTTQPIVDQHSQANESSSKSAEDAVFDLNIDTASDANPDSLEFDEAFDVSPVPPSNTETTASHTPANNISAEIFRAYDIRGIIGQTIVAETAYWIGRAVGAESIAQGESSVIIARDGRLSGPELSESLAKGLMEAGCNVIDIGMVPTPVLYFATHHLASRSGVMITGSHNPPDYNGFKIVVAGDTLSGERISALYTRIINNDLTSGNGSFSEHQALDQYVDYITQDIMLSRPMQVVLDAGNGSQGLSPSVYLKRLVVPCIRCIAMSMVTSRTITQIQVKPKTSPI